MMRALVAEGTQVVVLEEEGDADLGVIAVELPGETAIVTVVDDAHAEPAPPPEATDVLAFRATSPRRAG